MLHQVGAVLLRSGVSEIALSKMVSGLLGMVSFQALTMFIYALSRDGVYAIGSAFALFLSRAAEFGVAYPIRFMGTSHTYGVLGLSMLSSSPVCWEPAAIGSAASCWEPPQPCISLLRCGSA